MGDRDAQAGDNLRRGREAPVRRQTVERTSEKRRAVTGMEDVPDGVNSRRAGAEKLVIRNTR